MKATYPQHHYFCKVRSDSAVSFLSLAEESQDAEQTAFKRACRQIAKITMASGLKSSITFWIVNDMKVSDPQDNTMNFSSFANNNNIGGALRCMMDTDTHILKHVPPRSEAQQGKTKNRNTERDRGVGVDDVLSPTETIAALVGGGRLHRHGHRRHRLFVVGVTAVLGNELFCIIAGRF